MSSLRTPSEFRLGRSGYARLEPVPSSYLPQSPYRNHYGLSSLGWSIYNHSRADENEEIDVVPLKIKCSDQNNTS